MTCYELTSGPLLTDQQKICVITFNAIFTACNFVLNMFLCICIYLTNKSKNQSAILYFIQSFSFCCFGIGYQAVVPLAMLMGHEFSCTAKGISTFITQLFFNVPITIITLICVDR